MNKKGFTTKLSTIATVLQGQSPESAYYSDTEGTPFLQGNRTFGHLYPTFDTYTKKITKQAKKEDVLMSVRAPVGDLNYAPCDLCIGRGLASIRSKDGNNKFVYYALKYNMKNLLRQGAATTFDSVNKDIINDFELVVPEDKSHRNKAAKVLSVLDEKIEINTRINAELEAMAKTLYDYWFVQFDFPNESGMPYKSSGGKMVWSVELKREIPEGWKVQKIGDALDTVLGGTPSTINKSYWKNGTVNWLNSGEIAEFPIVSSELKITDAAIENSATELLPARSTLLSITRHLRPTILAIDACANQSVVGIKEKGDIKCTYIYPYLKNEIPRYLVVRTGAQQPHINKDTIDESYIVIPEILEQYNQITEPIYKQIINNAFQKKDLECLRNWLLPMLMNGQVRPS